MKISRPTRSSIISAVRSSTHWKSLQNGKSVHAQIIKCGFLPEIRLFNHLINFYSKSFDFVSAQKLFDDMPDRNLVSFSALISGYSQSNTPCYTFYLVSQLQKEGLSPNEFVFSSLIHASSRLRLVHQGKQIHAQVITSGFQSAVYVSSSLIDIYSKFGDSESAFSVFSLCTNADLVMYNSMISGFVKNGSYLEALELFIELLQHFVLKPTEVTICSAIKACANLEREIGEQVHCLTLKTGLDLDCFVSTALVDMYGSCYDMGSAEIIFESIFCGDLALYNAMIVGFSQNGLDESALSFFEKLKSDGFIPDECTFSSVLKACSGLKYLNFGRAVHGIVEKSEFRGELVVNTALIDLYMKCGCVEMSCRLFNNIMERNTVLYNSMIFGHGLNGNFDEAMKLFVDLIDCGYEPNLATFVVTMSSCSGHERCVYVHAIKQGFGLDLMVLNALLNGLMKRGVIEEAQELFWKMYERNVISWTIIISGLCQLGLDFDALENFKKMWSGSIHPNCFTFSCVLKAAGDLACLEHGRCIHGCCIKYGIVDEEFTKSSLLDMYSKCGALEESFRLFDEFSIKEIVSWNSIIAGCARHGYGGKALNFFKRMEEHGVEPNWVTFISLLSACSRCGLVDEGSCIFESMVNKYGVVPSMEHYACMVDAFGRAGMLGKAKCFIDNMPFEPDLLVWKIFLAACKLHGNLELAQLASEHVFKKGGPDNSTFVLMSNIYSDVGMWDDVEKLRKRMRDEAERKEPGVSWVQVNDMPCGLSY